MKPIRDSKVLLETLRSVRADIPIFVAIRLEVFIQRLRSG